MATTKTRAQGAAEAPQKSRIPTFQSIEEEAEFWDTHDSTEFEDEFEDVTGEVEFVGIRYRNSISMKLDEATLAALDERAAARGMGAATLAREWVLERLREPADQVDQR